MSIFVKINKSISDAIKLKHDFALALTLLLTLFFVNLTTAYAQDTQHKKEKDAKLAQLNSKILYFETAAWVTSGAVHAVATNGKHLRFVTDGSDLRIVQS